MNVLATYHGGGALTLSGPLDTVAHWDGGGSASLDPVVRGGRLHGRGSSDMKGGVAAMCLAAVSFVGQRPDARGFTVLLTADEESGCHGAAEVVRSGAVPPGAILIIAEATANQVRFGHNPNRLTTGARCAPRGRSARTVDGFRPAAPGPDGRAGYAC